MDDDNDDDDATTRRLCRWRRGREAGAAEEACKAVSGV